jgi:hypothetical protein
MTDYENYFGGCPKCGGNDGFANVGRSHWSFCTKHETKWWFGNNLLGSWRDETAEQQRVWYNANNLGSFEKVEPLEMVDSKFKPIAGDLSSYPTHDDWFAVVLSRQKEVAEMRDLAALDFLDESKRLRCRNDEDEIPF